MAPEQDMMTSWHLDKRVPVALIITLVSQMALAVWFFANLNNRVANNERALAQQQSELHGYAGTANVLAITLGRMDERLMAIKDTLDRIDQQPAPGLRK